MFSSSGSIENTELPVPIIVLSDLTQPEVLNQFKMTRARVELLTPIPSHNFTDRDRKNQNPRNREPLKTAKENVEDMSKLTSLNTTDATLIGGPTTTLFSLTFSQPLPPTPGVNSIIKLHDCTATGDAASGNLIATINAHEQSFGVTQILFDGALFKKGLVVVCSVAVSVTIETE